VATRLKHLRIESRGPTILPDDAPRADALFAVAQLARWLVLVGIIDQRAAARMGRPSHFGLALDVLVMNASATLGIG
jgi:hypothetical protein